MTLRTSNALFLAVLPPDALEGIGWEAVAILPDDFATVLAHVPRIKELSLSVTSNDFGMGSLTLDADDPALTAPLPAGIEGTVLSRECLWQFYEDGVLRHEWFGEDVQEKEASPDGSRIVTIAGRTTEKVLEWGVANPGTITIQIDDPKDEKPKGAGENWTPRQIDAEIVDPMEFEDKPAYRAVHWLINHVQERGACSMVTTTATKTKDSRGIEWTDNSEVVIERGETPLSLLRRLSEQFGWEFRMGPGFTLEVVQGGFGEHREAEVVHHIGGTQQEHEKSVTSREVASVVYAISKNGDVATAAGTSDAGPHRREVWLEAGDANRMAGAQRVANASLKTLMNRQVGRTLRVLPDAPGRRLFEDFFVNDWIGAEDAAGVIVPVKVLAATLAIKEDTAVALEVTVQTKREARAVRLARRIAKIGGDSSKTPSATPIKGGGGGGGKGKGSKVTDAGDVDVTGRAAWDVLRWHEPRQKWVPANAAQIVQRAEVGATDGQVLVWDAVEERWYPEDPPTALPPGDTEGHVLTWNATTGAWEARAATGGGGGGGGASPASIAAYAGGAELATGQATAAKGGVWKLNADTTITHIAFSGGVVTAGTYGTALFKKGTGDVIEEVLFKKGDLTFPVSGVQVIWVPLPTPVTVLAGTTIGLVSYRADQSGTFTFGDYTNNSRLDLGGISATRVSDVRLASNNPTAGQTFAVSTTGYGAGIIVQVP